MAWFFSGAIFVAILLEAILRLLPVAMGLYRTEQFERWPLQSSEPRLRYAYSIGWGMLNAHRGVTNNYGHIAPFDFQKSSRAVLVIGDSYVESLMNDYPDTLQGQLATLFNSPSSVYGLGVSGLSISDYLALSLLARDEFRPSAAVFVLTDGDFSESLGQRIGNYSLRPDGNRLTLQYAPLARDTWLKNIRKSIGDISIYRYFMANLGFSPDAVFKFIRHYDVSLPETGRAVQDADLQRKVADKFLGELPERLGLSPKCIVLLLDSDRYAIYRTGHPAPVKDLPAVRRYFIERAQKLGFKASDLEPIFRESYARNRTKFDYWPLDRHWNRQGHGVAAAEAYRLLSRPGQRECLPAIRFEGVGK